MDDGHYSALCPLPGRAGRPDELDLRPRRLRRWVAELPLASIGWTSGSLLEALKLIEQQPLPPSDRLQALEALRPGFTYAVHALRKRYGFHDVAGGSRSGEIHVLVTDMLGQAAASYRRVAVELPLAQPVRFRSQLALALHRAIRCYSGLLVEAFRLYQPVPAGLWRSLHEMYFMARAHGVRRLLVADDGLTSRSRCSPGQAYKQALLLFLLDPYQLRHQELDGVFLALKRAAFRTRLRRLDQLAPIGPAYFVDLTSDSGPARAPATDSGFWLDWEPLGPGQARLRSGRQGKKSIPPEVLQQVLAALERPLGARTQRLEHGIHLDAVIGLRQISQMLGEQQGLAEALPAMDVRWQFDPVSGKWRKVAAESDEPRADDDAVVRQARMLDLSADGCCLRLEQGPPRSARVGQALVLRPRAGEGDWQLGFIRWMRRDGEGLRLGVRFVPRQPQAVLIRGRDAQPGEAPDYGLVLRDPALPDGAATLLAPRFNYAARETLVVCDADGETDVRLGEELERTGSMQGFRLADAGEDPEPAVALEGAEPDVGKIYRSI